MSFSLYTIGDRIIAIDCEKWCWHDKMTRNNPQGIRNLRLSGGSQQCGRNFIYDSYSVGAQALLGSHYPHCRRFVCKNYGKKCVSFFELYSISFGSFKVVRLTDHLITQGKAKKTRKFAAVKRMISPKDTRMWVRSLRIIIITLTWLCVLTCNLVFHGRFQQRNSHNYCISDLFYQKENPGKRSREKEEGWRKRNTTRVRTSVIFVLWT